MSLFEKNRSLLETLEEAEARVEKIKIEGMDAVDDETRKQLALEIKTIVSRLVDNVAASSDDVEALGGSSGAGGPDGGSKALCRGIRY